MKKSLSLLLAVMLLLGCLPALAEDAEWKINQYTGLVSRRSAAEKLDSIVVPAEVDGIAVRGIEYMAFNMHKNFKHLTIADSAVMLDRRVLRDLLKLEAVELPENLLVIREGNFTNLPKLTSVVIPANVVLVHSSFNKCASLTSITFEGMCPVFVTAGTFGMFTDLPARASLRWRRSKPDMRPKQTPTSILICPRKATPPLTLRSCRPTTARPAAQS